MAGLQARRELIPGQRTIGFEATVAVDDVDRVTAAVKAAGGTILMEKTTITGVGDLVFFADPSGNICGDCTLSPSAAFTTSLDVPPLADTCQMPSSCA